jgi:replicative DNA helicase
MEFKSYEEELISKYKRRTLDSMADMIVSSDPKDDSDVILDCVKNTVDLLDHSVIDSDAMTKAQAINVITERWEKLFSNDFSDYIKTGISTLDDLIIGFQKKTNNIICARPAVGKTALGLTFMCNMVRDGHKVAFISVEMTKDQLIERSAFIMSGIPADIFTCGITPTTNDSQLVINALKDIENNNNFIMEGTNNRSINNVARIARKLKRDNKDLEVIIVDYVQKIEASKTKGNKTYEIEEVSGVLTDLGKKLDVAMVTLAQLNRASDDKAEELPKLSNLEGSSSLEKDADKVIMIHRSAKGALEASMQGNTKVEVFSGGVEQDMCSLQSLLYVSKNRSGKTGLAKTVYNARCTKFETYDPYNYDKSSEL